jgi:uncharacterized protein (TIGR02246 family)
VLKSFFFNLFLYLLVGFILISLFYTAVFSHIVDTQFNLGFLADLSTEVRIYRTVLNDTANRCNMDTSSSQNSSQQNIYSLIEQAKSAWIDRNADTLSQLFTLDGELVLPGESWKGRQKIREEIDKFSQQYKDVVITIHRVIIDGNQAAVEWQYEDTEIATNKRNLADDVIILEVKDGQISYWREYFDIKTPLRQSSE